MCLQVTILSQVINLLVYGGHMVLLVREKGEAKSDIYNGHESP